jgi:hypothetical protein
LILRKILFSIILYSCSVFCQSVSITSEIDTSIASIGDVITWTIKSNKSGYIKNLEFPELNLQGDSVSIYSQRLIENGGQTIGRVFEIAFWDTGKFYTPPYFVNVLNEHGDIQYDIKIEEVPIAVISVLASLDDKNLRPIKNPVPVRGIIPYRIIILIILSLAIILAIILVWKKRDIIINKANYIVNNTPMEIAKNRLANLNEKGFAKDFYTEISHITREYIEHSKYIKTLEMTTEEIINNRTLFLFDDNSFFEWTDLLSKADLVKYAKQAIEVSEMESDRDKAINFIDNFFARST